MLWHESLPKIAAYCNLARRSGTGHGRVAGISAVATGNTRKSSSDTEYSDREVFGNFVAPLDRAPRVE